jgi:Leucine-rich repeat (LRR) protein
MCQTDLFQACSIGSFTNITELVCDTNSLTSLDVTGLANLNYLDCYSNSVLASINVAGLSSLEYLDCSYSVLNSEIKNHHSV